MEQTLLEVNNLQTYFYTDGGIVKAVDDVSFTIHSGKTLGVVGESGCGKSITSLSIMQLVETPPGKIVGGEILYHGENLLEKSRDEMRKIRGDKIAMIFQEPMTSLNPVFTVGQQIMEAICIHNPHMDRQAAKKKAISMLNVVKIPLPEQRFNEYPHQLSGGMRQRVMIAMALSCEPELLICDEPTTALDVTIQAQILDLINELKNNMGAAIMMITHDLGVIAEIADEVMVMYAGKVVEYALTDDLFDHPMHPYTIGLMECIPKLTDEMEELSVIKGTVPAPNNMPKGCSFCPRCKDARPICEEQMPELIEANGRKIRCFKYTEQWRKEVK
jgi:oligopeptide/dipeptide ABC transporter ATP-binding protein